MTCANVKYSTDTFGKRTNIKKLIFGLFTYVGITASLGVQAEDFILEGSLGAAEPQSGSYDSSLLMEGSAGFHSNGWIYRIGFTVFDAFKSDDANNKLEIETSGAYLHAAKIVDLEPFNLEIGAGLYRTRSEAFMAKSPHNSGQRKIGSAYGTSPFATIALVKEINTLLSLQGGFKYINDVSGSDLNMIYAGIRFNF